MRLELRIGGVHSERHRIGWRPGQVRRSSAEEKNGTDAGSNADKGCECSLNG